MKSIPKLLKKAIAAKAQMDSASGQIANLLQPFFKNEISVDFQPGHGFVVIWEDSSSRSLFCAPNNMAVADVVKTIQNNPAAFLNN